MLNKNAIQDVFERALSSIGDASRDRRRALINRRFTIISNDCWGAEVYKDLGLPYETPLIGTYVMGPCYMKIAADAHRLLTTPISFIDRSRYVEVNQRRELQWFPIGLLADDVEIHFLHYSSIEEAQTKWQRRLLRSHFDRLFFKLSADKDLFTDADLALFETLPIEKIAFSKKSHPSFASVVTIPEYEIDGKAMYQISLQYFNIVHWLNNGVRGEE